MRLSRALEEKKLDLRLRDKLTHEGKLTPKQIEEYLKTLSDDQSKATFTERGHDHQSHTPQ
ncbi:MAG: hypothetical protein COW00_16785 [Bdellovibrio sp. CG12_big_fil_rev_8_21_14_0_65_39_13]|nr:MAG: hypothetical protein COW78_10075 [Bdellovibrio sp. CG22_combo_CG10-13_8_21_14_all_39_27]PIQ58261.1 MAG: hypothetical protein COW00_16785 [Bdellovibrio sp. CG12_big_fil_rev_8_21_14_0_65_39_13]PIR36670.1 MAG: hypothetical protein COV37_02305 [Bdellovibrio sp. CG11_big_fil_rev_8_21_14_0_20_39_38]PJB53352.1 MAG: hypothetical protein CO099_07595 [Bdellovibrio sp. CG_4_9_14_3_um_filter_39_7]